MNSSELRKSFLDFFKSKGHTIVPSASLLPSSPNLLFTNAGMNQFVPYFLGDLKAPFQRATDTQKCIRAGGKHNDLEDVGFDTYHHTFFEMLGNWSFGDYFKKEAIEWAWELLVKTWGFPKERLYATVYEPSDGDPATFDSEAYSYWEEIFKRENLDPTVHIKKCSKKDNFWMMGETGPCGPCSEIHIDLTQNGDTKGNLVNTGSPLCIEIWNLVFIQFNAEENGNFIPLKNRHVDTGMGFERVAGIIATTKNFSDFSTLASNYNCDLFTDIFTEIERMSGKVYGKTIPENRDSMSLQELTDCIFRVLADHIRTLSFSIADGIMPGSEGRNYVLRRILRRAVMYGKRLKLSNGFFTRLSDVVINKMGDVFPELVENQKVIRKVIENEEKSFERTLDRGLMLLDNITKSSDVISGEEAFVLYDTYGFPIDLTELIARERNLKVDVAGFESAMEKQRERARSSQKKEVISVSEDRNLENATEFVGYDSQNYTDFDVSIAGIVNGEDCDFLVFEQTPFYAEKGGQVGDAGYIIFDNLKHQIFDTILDSSGLHLHKVKKGIFTNASLGKSATVFLDVQRRKSIERHHSATHILHWALRKVLGTHVKQAGSYVDSDRLRFDYSHFEAPTHSQIREVELLANKKILESISIKWYEVPHNEIPKNCLAFFGDKYGAVVRVVDMDGTHAELCGGTHVSTLGEIGIVKIISESAIASGIRRIEAVAGIKALEYIESLEKTIEDVRKTLSCKAEDVSLKVEKLNSSKIEIEKELKNIKKIDAEKLANDIITEAFISNGLNFIIKIVNAEDTNSLRDMSVKISKSVDVVVLAADISGKASVLASCSANAIEKGVKAGDIIKNITSKIDGRGGGKPDFAQGGGTFSLLHNAFTEFKKTL